MRHTYACSGALLILLTVTCPLSAAKVTFGPADLIKFSGNKKALTFVSDNQAASGGAAEASAAFRLETYGLQRLLQPGWHRLTLRVRITNIPVATEALSFAFWCPNQARNPETFRYETTFVREEFPSPGHYGELTRLLYLGPSFGNYGMLLQGFKGLRVESLTLEPIARPLTLEQVRANKLLYGLRETGTVAVHVLNTTGQPQSARLSVTVESGLDDNATLFDKEIKVAGDSPDRPIVIEVPLPAQPEYGHAVIATLRQGNTTVGTARDYFYTTNRPAQIGHLGAIGIADAYSVGNAASSVEDLRRHCFPMYEIIFWAPDDAMELVPPPGKNRWWSGQTLARVTTDSLKERIRLGQSQGMKVLAYTNLRYDFGYRIAETFRQHPEFCEWDANNTDLAYSVDAIRRQAREDDAERFDPSAPNKPKFKAEGVWRLATGNPALVDAHIDQLVRSTKLFGWDGWRYDDRYNYDEPAVDLLGRQLPADNWRNPAILAHIRESLEKAKPGIIYGHNMEWAQDQPVKADKPMPLDTPPHPNDYYTEFLRDGGLHLQERWAAQMVSGHAPWTEVRDNLLALGHNAYRRGGYAYGLSYVNGARPNDARHLVALHCAGLTHLAADVQEANISQMRLACRYADLLYGDYLVPVLDSEKILHVDSKGKPVWWQHSVRYREVAPGRRIYLAHLINPPRGTKVGEGDSNPPDPMTNVALTWKLPPGWKAVHAYQLSGEGDTSIETVVSAGAWARQRKDVVGYRPFRKELAFREEDNITRVTLPRLDIWSLVALDCNGPANEITPSVLFPLPALPTDRGGKFEEARGASPNRVELVYDASNANAWTWPDPKNRGKRLPLEQVADPGATKGQAVRCAGSWQMEAYRSGEAIQGGLYRFSFRVKSTNRPPSGAMLVFSAWNPPGRKQSWRINQSLSLSDLVPDKGWQTFTREVELGYGDGNFGLQVKQGFDGLLIDQVKIEEVRRHPDSKLLRTRGLTGWPKDQKLTPHQGLRVWLGDGLYSEHYRLIEALRKIQGLTVTRVGHWVYREQRGLGKGTWTKPEELANYDLVILSNIDCKTLSLEQRDWLRGFVEAGGALWLLGGPYSLGRGGWQSSDLIEPILPVKLHDYDLRPTGVDTPLPLTVVAGGLLTNAPVEHPVTLWLHEVEPKSGAVVQLKAGDKPALVTGTAGKGRIAILTVTPLGKESANVLVWWKWAGWEKTMIQVASWLLKKPTVE